jgi:hypothetical protein
MKQRAPAEDRGMNIGIYVILYVYFIVELNRSAVVGSITLLILPDIFSH